MTVYREWTKRSFDLLILLLTAPFVLPLVTVVAMLVRINMGTPIIFRQMRAGYQGKLFLLCKFRTMNSERDEKGELLPDEKRITKLGQWLRNSSLDELPQLWNVLKADMTLVGPRPLFARYIGRYTPEQARRHEVKPGLTGWSQVNGRNAITWNDRFQQDVWYVDHWSFGLDLRIIARTIRKVFRREGISSTGHATMPEFMGKNEAR
jgi:sugar transferase EpsL